MKRFLIILIILLAFPLSANHTEDITCPSIEDIGKEDTNQLLDYYEKNNYTKKERQICGFHRHTELRNLEKIINKGDITKNIDTIKKMKDRKWYIDRAGPIAYIAISLLVIIFLIFRYLDKKHVKFLEKKHNKKKK
tara:strand:- start:336 stop:743 length:408 start_codon:yes stop_codon:yes gene_type:complete